MEFENNPNQWSEELMLRNVYAPQCRILEPVRQVRNDPKSRLFYRVTVAFPKNDPDAVKQYEKIKALHDAHLALNWSEVNLDTLTYKDGRRTLEVGSGLIDGDKQEKPRGGDSNWKPGEAIEGHYALKAKLQYQDQSTLPIFWPTLVQGRPLQLDRNTHHTAIKERAFGGRRLNAVVISFGAWTGQDRFISAYVKRIQLSSEQQPRGAQGFEFEEGDAPAEDGYDDQPSAHDIPQGNGSPASIARRSAPALRRSGLRRNISPKETERVLDEFEAEDVNF